MGADTVEPLDFRILGALEVGRGNGLIELGGPKQRALLAILLSHTGETVTTDRLIEDLWSGQSPPSARNLVQVYVSGLRKALEPQRPRGDPPTVIVTRGQGYALDVAEMQIDATRFVQLVEDGRRALEDRDAAAASSHLSAGLALWRGPAFIDFAYEPFAQPEIARLEELRLAAIEYANESDLMLGRHDRLLLKLDALVLKHPLRERLRSQLMLAMYRAGRQADALRVYREGRRVLAEELGIEPGPDLQRLELAVLLRDPTLARSPPSLRAPEIDPVASTATVLLVKIEGDQRSGTAVSTQSTHELIAEAVGRHEGRLTNAAQYGAYQAVFRSPTHGLLAALDMHRILEVGSAEGPYIRMALNTGPAKGDGSYQLEIVTRCASLLAFADSGETVVSAATRWAADESLLPEAHLTWLGEHRLHDLGNLEQVYGLDHDGRSTSARLHSLDDVPNNLPILATSFIGRHREVSEVESSLSSSRLVTLTGPGGTGKTRLSLQVAGKLATENPDGVWVVDLASVAVAELVPHAVASTLGVREQPDRPLGETLSGYLGRRTVLLVLDNCEHVLNSCRQLVETLLGACPRLRVLATSREPLGSEGEVVWRVRPLATPNIDTVLNLEELQRWEAISLFVDRARNVDAAFSLTDNNAQLIAGVCNRLDGIPLALELAASRLRVLSVQQLADRLEDRFSILAGSTAELPRHRTLRATMGWSYALLSQTEKVVFRRIAVFTGSFTPDAAEGVCTGMGIHTNDVLDALEQLEGKSMVAREKVGQESRYRLLEAVREYGRELLLTEGEARMLRKSHRDWYLRFAEEAETEIRGPMQATWFDRLEQEYKNLRAALQSAQSDGDNAAVLRLAGAMWFFWYVRGYMSEGFQWLETALAVGDQLPSKRAKALQGLAVLALNLGHNRLAEEACTESLALCRETGDREGVGLSLNFGGLVARYETDYDRAADLHSEALDTARESRSKALIALSLNFLGLVSWYRGDSRSALELIEESSVIFREIGDAWPYSLSLAFLGKGAVAEGHPGRATALFEESLAICQQMKNLTIACLCLEGLAGIALTQGEPRKAAELLRESLFMHERTGEIWRIAQCLEQVGDLALQQSMMDAAAYVLGAAEALREAASAPLSRMGESAHEQLVTSIRQGLGEELMAEAWAEGRSTVQGQAIAFGLSITAAIGDDPETRTGARLG